MARTNKLLTVLRFLVLVTPSTFARHLSNSILVKQRFIFFMTVLGLAGHPSTSLVATPTDSLRVQELLQLVEQHSKEIELSTSTISLKNATWEEAKVNRLPTLSVFAEVDKATNMPVYSNGLFHRPEQHDVIHTLYQTGANLYFNVYNGLKTRNTIALAKLDHSLAESSLQHKKATIKLKAIYLFYDLYLQRSWASIMQADIAEKVKEAEEIKHLFTSGVVLESDVIRASLEISKRKMTLLEIHNDIEVLQQQLNVLIGEPDTNVIIPTVLLVHTQNTDATLANVLEIGSTNAYEEKISHVQVAMANKRVDIARSGNKFQLGVVGSFQFSNPQIFLYPYNADWYSLGIIGLKASYAISSLYHNPKKVAVAKIEAHEAHLQHSIVQDNIRTALFEAYHSYHEAKAHVPIREQNVTYTTENERIITNAYFSQTALITDLLDANLMDLKAQFELTQAKVNVFKAYYTLAFAQGQL